VGTVSHWVTISEHIFVIFAHISFCSQQSSATVSCNFYKVCKSNNKVCGNKVFIHHTNRVSLFYEHLKLLFPSEIYFP
jgi:hypothetical protein